MKTPNQMLKTLLEQYSNVVPKKLEPNQNQNCRFFPISIKHQCIILCGHVFQQKRTYDVVCCIYKNTQDRAAVYRCRPVSHVIIRRDMNDQWSTVTTRAHGRSIASVALYSYDRAIINRSNARYWTDEALLVVRRTQTSAMSNTTIVVKTRDAVHMCHISKRILK